MATETVPAAITFPVDQAWLDKGREDILEPGLPIVDPHHHLWERDSRYLFDELRADLNTGHNIVATVFLQCGAMIRAGGDPDFAAVGETEFVNGVAAMSASGLYGPTRVCAGIVGHADLRLGARVRPVLEAHLRASGRFRGIRNSSTYSEDERLRTTPRFAPKGLLADARFREGFACLAPLDLSFDAWLYFTQLGELADLARAFPETKLILNHCGAPLGIGPYAGKREEVFAAWRQGIAELARCPNVHVKLGGLGMRVMGFGFEAKPLPPTSTDLAEAWRPYLETCIAAFGPDRAMFESNFPVDKQSCAYPVLWNAFKRIAVSYSEDEKKKLFSGTASKVYRL